MPDPREGEGVAVKQAEFGVPSRIQPSTDGSQRASLPTECREWQDRSVTQLFRLPGATRNDPNVDAWFAACEDEARHLVKPWFDRMRACGRDVRERLHDGWPTACVDDAAFGYVSAFSAHANIGFFYGAMLDDPAGLLEGSGKRMRHVKLSWGRPGDAAALEELVAVAYRDIRERLGRTCRQR